VRTKEPPPSARGGWQNGNDTGGWQRPGRRPSDLGRTRSRVLLGCSPVCGGVRGGQVYCRTNKYGVPMSQENPVSPAPKLVRPTIPLSTWNATEHGIPGMIFSSKP